MTTEVKADQGHDEFFQAFNLIGLAEHHSAQARVPILQRFFGVLQTLPKSLRAQLLEKHFVVALLKSNGLRETFLSIEDPCVWLKWLLGLLIDSDKPSSDADSKHEPLSADLERQFVGLVLTCIVAVLSHCFHKKDNSNPDALAALATSLLNCCDQLFGWCSSSVAIARLALNATVNKIANSVDVFRADLQHPCYANLLSLLPVFEEFIFYRPHRPLEEAPPSEINYDAPGLHLDDKGCLDAVLVENLCKMLAKLRLPSLEALPLLALDKKDATAQKLIREKLIEIQDGFAATLCFMRQLQSATPAEEQKKAATTLVKALAAKRLSHFPHTRCAFVSKRLRRALKNAFQTVQRHGLHERLTQLCEISQSLYFGVEMRSTRQAAGEGRDSSGSSGGGGGEHKRDHQLRVPSTPLTAARRNSWATQDPRSLPLPSAAAAPAADVPAAAGAGVVAVGDSKAEQAPASQRTERKRSVEGKRNPRGSPRAAGRSPPSDGSSSSASSSSAEAASGSLSPRPLSQNAHYIKADVHVTKSPLSASGSVSATDSNVFIDFFLPNLDRQCQISIDADAGSNKLTVVFDLARSITASSALRYLHRETRGGQLRKTLVLPATTHVDWTVAPRTHVQQNQLTVTLARKAPPARSPVRGAAGAGAGSASRQRLAMPPAAAAAAPARMVAEHEQQQQGQQQGHQRSLQRQDSHHLLAPLAAASAEATQARLHRQQVTMHLRRQMSKTMLLPALPRGLPPAAGSAGSAGSAASSSPKSPKPQRT